MKVSDPVNQELKGKILKGLDLTFKKLLKSKRQVGGTFVFSKDGKIKKVKATDMKG